MKKKIGFFIKYWLPPLVWAGVIYRLSSKPIFTGSPVYWQDFTFKKGAHIFFYGIYAILIYRALKESGVSKLKAAYWSVILTFFYGTTDEFHQSFVRGRTPTLRDVIIDTFAASLVMFVIYKYVDTLPKRLLVFFKKFDLV